MKRKTYVNFLSTSSFTLTRLYDYYKNRLARGISRRRNPVSNLEDAANQMLFFMQGLGWQNWIDSQLGEGKGQEFFNYLKNQVTNHWDQLCLYFKVGADSQNPEKAIDYLITALNDKAPLCYGGLAADGEEYPHSPGPSDIGEMGPRKLRFFSPLDPNIQTRTKTPRFKCEGKLSDEDHSSCNTMMNLLNALQNHIQHKAPFPTPLPSPLAELHDYWAKNNGTAPDYIGISPSTDEIVVGTNQSSIDSTTAIDQLVGIDSETMEEVNPEELIGTSTPGTSDKPQELVGIPKAQTPTPTLPAPMVASESSDLPEIEGIPISVSETSDLPEIGEEIIGGVTEEGIVEEEPTKPAPLKKKEGYLVFSPIVTQAEAPTGAELADVETEEEEEGVGSCLEQIDLPILIRNPHDGTDDLTKKDGCIRQQYRGPGPNLSKELHAIGRKFDTNTIVQLDTGLWDLAHGNYDPQWKEKNDIRQAIRWIKPGGEGIQDWVEKFKFYGTYGKDPGSWQMVVEPWPHPKGELQSRYEWQDKAVERWATGDNGWCKFTTVGLGTPNERPAPYNGIVEACTGSGKTKFALKCLRRLLLDKPNENITITIICPPLKEVQLQWLCEFQEAVTAENGILTGLGLTKDDLALFGGDFSETGTVRKKVNIYVVNAAVGKKDNEEETDEKGNLLERLYNTENLKKDLGDLQAKGQKHFLIVDELHRCNPRAQQFTKVFESKIHYALLITGTMISGEYIKLRCTDCHSDVIDPKTHQTVRRYKEETVSSGGWGFGTNPKFKYVKKKVKDEETGEKETEHRFVCIHEGSKNLQENHNVEVVTDSRGYSEHGTFLDYFQKMGGPSVAFYSYPEALEAQNISKFRIWFINTPYLQQEQTIANSLSSENTSEELAKVIRDFQRDCSLVRAHQLIRVAAFALKTQKKLLTFGDRTPTLKILHRYLIENIKKHVKEYSASKTDPRNVIGAHHSNLSPYYGETPVLHKFSIPVPGDPENEQLPQKQRDKIEDQFQGMWALGTQFLTIPTPYIYGNVLRGYNKKAKWHDGVLPGDTKVKIIIDDFRNSDVAKYNVTAKYALCDSDIAQIIFINPGVRNVIGIRALGRRGNKPALVDSGDMIGRENLPQSGWAYVKKIVSREITQEDMDQAQLIGQTPTHITWKLPDKPHQKNFLLTFSKAEAKNKLKPELISSYLFRSDLIEIVTLNKPLPIEACLGNQDTTGDWQIRLTIHPRDMDDGSGLKHFPAIPEPMPQEAYRRNHKITFGLEPTLADKQAKLNELTQKAQEYIAAQHIQGTARQKRILKNAEMEANRALKLESKVYTAIVNKKYGSKSFRKVYSLKLSGPMQGSYPAGLPIVIEQNPEKDTTILKRNYMDEFRAGPSSPVQIMLSAKSLLEGVDLPEVDIGVAISPTSTSNPIPNLQSLGRVLRVKPGQPTKDYIVFHGSAKEERVVQLFEKYLKKPVQAESNETKWICEHYHLNFEQFFGTFSKVHGIIPLERPRGELKIAVKGDNPLQTVSEQQIVSEQVEDANVFLVDSGVDFSKSIDLGEKEKIQIEDNYRVILKLRPDDLGTWRYYSVMKHPANVRKDLVAKARQDKLNELAPQILTGSLTQQQAEAMAEESSKNLTVNFLKLKNGYGGLEQGGEVGGEIAQNALWAKAADYQFLKKYNKAQTASYSVEMDFAIEQDMLYRHFFQLIPDPSLEGAKFVKPDAFQDYEFELSKLDAFQQDVSNKYFQYGFKVPDNCELCGCPTIESKVKWRAPEYFGHLTSGSEKKPSCIGRQKLKSYKKLMNAVNMLLKNLKMYEHHNKKVIERLEQEPNWPTHIKRAHYCEIRKLRQQGDQVALQQKMDEINKLLEKGELKKAKKPDKGKYRVVCLAFSVKGRGKPSGFNIVSKESAIDFARKRLGESSQPRGRKQKVEPVTCYIEEKVGSEEWDVRIIDPVSEQILVPAPSDLIGQYLVVCGANFFVTTDINAASQQFDKWHKEFQQYKAVCQVRTFSVEEGSLKVKILKTNEEVVTKKGTRGRPTKSGVVLSEAPFTLWSDVMLTAPVTLPEGGKQVQIGYQDYYQLVEYVNKTTQAMMERGWPAPNYFIKASTTLSNKPYTLWLDSQYKIPAIIPDTLEQIGFDSPDKAIHKAYLIEQQKPGELGGLGSRAIFIKGLPFQYRFYADAQFKAPMLKSADGKPLISNLQPVISDPSGVPLETSSKEECSQYSDLLQEKGVQFYLFNSRGKNKRYWDPQAFKV